MRPRQQVVDLFVDLIGMHCGCEHQPQGMQMTVIFVPCLRQHKLASV